MKNILFLISIIYFFSCNSPTDNIINEEIDNFIYPISIGNTWIYETTTRFIPYDTLLTETISSISRDTIMIDSLYCENNNIYRFKSISHHYSSEDSIGRKITEYHYFSNKDNGLFSYGINCWENPKLFIEYPINLGNQWTYIDSSTYCSDEDSLFIQSEKEVIEKTNEMFKIKTTYYGSTYYGYEHLDDFTEFNSYSNQGLIKYINQMDSMELTTVEYSDGHGVGKFIIESELIESILNQ